jgi:glycosyltransferase involved in cell wall biosynthesis
MGAGLPQVVTNISGSQDMIRDGYNGFVVEPGDPDVLADALGRLAGDEDLRRRIGRQGQEESRDYSWDRISRKYLEHMV